MELFHKLVDIYFQIIWWKIIASAAAQISFHASDKFWFWSDLWNGFGELAAFPIYYLNCPSTTAYFSSNSNVRISRKFLSTASTKFFAFFEYFFEKIILCV